MSADILAESIVAAEFRQRKRMDDSSFWKEGSRELVGEELHDANILNTGNVWAMLVALVFENILKGIIVANEFPNLKDGEKNPIHGHGLLQLAQRAKINISVHDAELLKELTEFSVWKGRYNTPNHPDTLFKLSKSQHSKPGVITLWPISKAAAVCRSLFERINAEFDKSRQNWRDAQSNNAQIGNT